MILLSLMIIESNGVKHLNEICKEGKLLTFRLKG